MKTLITGATGFVGSAVLRKLVSVGHDVRALVRPQSDRRNLLELPIEIVHGDLRDRSSLEKAVKGCSVLFHVAADYRFWVPRPDELYEVNVTGSRNIVLAAADAGVERIVYTSSVAVLGSNKDESPADEETPVTLAHMIGHYKRSKFLAEAEIRELVKSRGLPVVIVNPSTVVGPRDIKPTPSGRMIIDAASGRMPAYVDTGLNFVHVEDVAEGHLLALERGRVGERYILGGANLTLKEALSEIASIAGRKPPRIRLPHNLVLVVAAIAEAWSKVSGKEPWVNLTSVRLARKKMYFSTEKAQRELGYRPRSIRDAFHDAIDWYRRHGYIDGA
ncbi:MAG: NAD-dependent epimerase/dehydratase family protein [Syntrophobacterales bacterium]|jgi:dihydroflavonol-4-reductase|nr:NAD-dependent epimerase/dehydratase family protein [Syntrophobacterales bacterium]